MLEEEAAPGRLLLLLYGGTSGRHHCNLRVKCPVMIGMVIVIIIIIIVA